MRRKAASERLGGRWQGPTSDDVEGAAPAAGGVVARIARGPPDDERAGEELDDLGGVVDGAGEAVGVLGVDGGVEQDRVADGGEAETRRLAEAGRQG